LSSPVMTSTVSSLRMYMTLIPNQGLTPPTA
jgi:hypothetical protein